MSPAWAAKIGIGCLGAIFIHACDIAARLGCGAACTCSCLVPKPEQVLVAAVSAFLCRPVPLLLQVKPVREDQLMSGTGDVKRLINLAALSDSLDYLADAIHRFGDSQQPQSQVQVSLCWPASGSRSKSTEGSIMHLSHHMSNSVLQMSTSARGIAVNR